MTDATGNRTCYEYTLTSQLKKVEDTLGNEAVYTYDGRDHLVEIRQYEEKEEDGREQNVHCTTYQRIILK